MIRRTPRTLAPAALIAAALAASAMARPVDLCNPAIPYTMPDHDQRRNTAVGIIGLQNNGSQYCVPTCTTDILTYLQNHGYPALGMGPGAGPWLGNQAIYNAFSTDIESLATLMNTDPFGGTGGTNAFNGVNDWIDNVGYTGDIVVTAVGMDINNAPELGDIAFCLIARCPISISVGWYENTVATTFVRRGGHCVAVSRLPNFCSGVQSISIRDPGSSTGSDAFSQAAGTTETYTIATPSIIRRAASDNSVVYSGPVVRILGYGASNRTAIIDGYRAYFPAFGLAACNNPVNGSCVTQHIPNPSFTGQQQTTHQTFPAGSTILDLDIGADNLSAWFVGQTDAGDYVLWRKNFGSQPAAQSVPALTALSPQRVCSTNDPRTLFFLGTNANILYRLNTTTGAVTPISIAAPSTAICFDHKRNELVAFSSTARSVTRIDPTTGAPLSARTLPSSVAVGTTPRITICPKGSYIWLTSGVNTGYGLINDTATTLTIAATISGSQPLRGVDADDRGHVFTTSGGLTLEFKEPVPAVPGGPWTPVSGGKFATLADGPIFRIARHRTNLTRAIHDAPEETLAILPDIVAPSIPDCAADFDRNGIVSIDDLFKFFNAWFLSEIEADANESNSITIDDLFFYINLYFTGC